jgi:hypothetical protein
VVSLTSPASIITSQITKDQRWDKLYRIIHHLFLRKEFVHIDDYNLMIQQLNARITAVEAAANASIASLTAFTNANIIAHTHTITAPGSQSAPGLPILPIVLPPPPPTPIPMPVTTAMIAKDNLLMAAGPALAPLSGGVSPDQLRADLDINADILSSEISI